MNSDRSSILVIVLGLVGAVIIGAIILASLTRPVAQATEEVAAESTAEATAETTEEATAETTEQAGETEGQSGVSGEERPLPTPVPGRPRRPPSALQPQGPFTGQITTQWWVMLSLGTIIYLYVMVLLLMTIYRQEPNIPEDEDSPVRQRNFIAFNGFAIPIVTLTIVFAITLGSLSNYARQRPQMTVEVIGHQWWWEVRYPDHEIVTANEIHIPVEQPVRFTLTSADVIHSFWVPELGGKMDLIPGQTNRFWLQADNPGEYRGQCAEFCGIQHAKMAFLVIADTPETFETWVEAQRQPAAQPSDELAAQGQQVFLNSECIACHTIRGTDVAGVQGPDLTHLASRRTLGAGTLPNTTGHLAGWIVDSQGIKPGNRMPPMDVSGQNLRALLAYLNSLD